MARDFKVNVKTNARELKREFGRLAKSQLPFAIAAGLTDTAKEAREKVRKDLPNRFTVRSRRVLSTVVFEPASKRDFPRSKAIVGIRDKFIARHEKGGRVRTETGARFAIPFRFVKRTATGRIPARFKPRKIRSKPNTITTEDEIQRKGTKRTRGVRRIHFLRQSINLRPKLGFLSTVSILARHRFKPNMETRLRKAIKDTELRAARRAR